MQFPFFMASNVRNLTTNSNITNSKKTKLKFLAFVVSNRDD